MTNKMPGGEFAGAWEAVAAATRGRKRRGWGGEFAAYTTAEMIQDVGGADERTRVKMEAEIARRTRR